MKKNKKNIPVTQRSLFSWIFSEGLKLQFLLILVIMVTVFARVVPLEMQKKIINEAIFLKKTDKLMTYCGIYLIAVITSTGMKYLINVLQTLIGQKALASMRKALYHHIITLSINFFRKTQAGMVVSSLVTEIASAGDFIGMALAIPITNIMTLLAFGGYLFWLNPMLAIVSLSIYPLVMILIPQLQKRANKANKERVDITRTLSDKIGESIAGIHEIHGNGTYSIENAKYDTLVDKLKKIRVRWNLYRQGVKACNNFFNNLSPFLIFIIGGYLTIKGQLELGSLVAFLSAQEKLYDPWKEILEFYQSYQDASIRYKRVMEYFDTMPEHVIECKGREPYELDGSIEVKNLSFATETGIKLLNNVNFSIKHGEQLAVVGFSGSGKSTLAQCIAQLNKYTKGHVFVGGKEVSEMTKEDIINNMGIVSQSPFIFKGTIEENLLYSCYPLIRPDREKTREEPSLDDKISALQQAGIFVDVLRFGLNMILNHKDHADLVDKITRVRKNFQNEFGETLGPYVEFFNENTYQYYSSITENIIFGTTDNKEFLEENLPENRYFLKFLDEAQLTRPLLRIGAELAAQTVDILGNLPAEALFFEQSPLKPDEVEEYKIVTERIKKVPMHRLSPEDHKKLLEIALRFTPGRHKMIALPEIIKALILEARTLFKEKTSKDFPDLFSFYDMSTYIGSQTILNNILFGKLKTTNPKAQEKINQNIIQLLIEEDLLEAILNIGMQFDVGSKGGRLSGGQCQKLAIARIFLKNPKILIMDEATSALDNNSQARIQNLLERLWKGKSTVISVIHRLDIIKNYDRIAVMKSGKIGEFGTYNELIEKRGMLYELVYGK